MRLSTKQAATIGIAPSRTKTKKVISVKPVAVQSKYSCKVTLPGVPPSLNRWTNLHWTVKCETKKDWEYLIRYTVNKIAPFKKPIVRIIYYFNTNRRRDKDNYTPKFIMDGLVKAGVIKDDNINAVDLDWDIRIDKNGNRTEVFIKEAE